MYRAWFWPLALVHGLRWLFEVSEHPAIKIAERILVVLALFGAVVVLHIHVEAFLFLLFLVFFFLGIWAKGARLKWLQDRQETTVPPPAPAAPSIGEYHAHGPTLVLGREALPLTQETIDQLSRVTPKQVQPARPGSSQPPKAGSQRADDSDDHVAGT
jgi:hypothetical protein